MIADLHCHSRFSDGSTNTESIIRYAKKSGLDYIALTDHDTLKGVESAKEYGKKYNISIITGVECSCLDKERGRSVHMLCYMPKDINTLQKALDKTLESRRKQKLQIIENVRKMYDIEVEDVLRFVGESQSIYECHIMQALADKGYTNVICGDLMKELMSSKGSCYVKTDYRDVRETVRIISDCGGIPVLAHPEEYDSLELAQELAEKKLLKGVEIYHPRNSEKTRDVLSELAQKYDLIITGGSDCHGQFSKSPHPIGYCTTDKNNLKKILSYK